MDNATQKLAGLADTVRGVSGVSGKLSVDDMKTTVGQLSAFKDYGQLDFNADCNDLINPGTYSLHSKSANSPTGAWGYLRVIVYNGADIEQNFISMEDSTHPCKYFRFVINGRSWSAWVKLGGVNSALYLLLLPSLEVISWE